MPSSDSQSAIPHAARQEQFLDVIGRDEAAARFQAHLQLSPLGVETVLLSRALGRVLAGDVVAEVDVPGFDRSNVDGFALRAADTFGAGEEQPRRVTLNPEVLAPGVPPETAVRPGTATPIATGGMLPRGADAVAMVEDTELVHSAEAAGGPALEITRAVTPGRNITFAGTDIARGETVLRAGQRITSREVGVLAAIGRADVEVFRRPRVAVISTGNEIVAPGRPCPPGFVYDSNLAILSAAIEELGGEPVALGVVSDDERQLSDFLARGLECDAVVLSGGTSKGAGDLSYRVVSRLSDPGIVAHGVALKPGKPICLAVTGGKPVVILPGFPTSAIFTFHEFVAPVIRAFAGLKPERRDVVTARLPMRINSERGRTEYLLVGLVRSDGGLVELCPEKGTVPLLVAVEESSAHTSEGTAPFFGQSRLVAYPMGKGSGSVTTFSLADGFIAIGSQTEILEAGSTVEVQLLSRELQPADLVVIGSHCVGLDFLLGQLQRRGFTAKAMHVGSTGGLAAAKRGECDLAGIHLMDPDTGEYNRPLLTPELELVAGYRRMQGIVFRPGDPRFESKSVAEAAQAAASDPDCTMVNRNAGSGTRIVIDRLLEGKRPPGYAVQAKSHNAVATAVSQHRADWGVAIDTVARQYGLSFLPVQDEQYDFVVPKSRLANPAVEEFKRLLADDAIRRRLSELGFRFSP